MIFGLSQALAERLTCACFVGALAVAFILLGLMVGDLMRGPT